MVAIARCELAVNPKVVFVAHEKQTPIFESSEQTSPAHMTHLCANSVHLKGLQQTKTLLMSVNSRVTHSRRSDRKGSGSELVLRTAKCRSVLSEPH